MTILLAILLSNTDLTIVLSCEPHCQAAREQWNSQYQRDRNGLLYQHRFANELAYIHKHFDVKLLDEVEFPTQMNYPVIRFGYGGNVEPLRKYACFPGHFLPAIYAMCREFLFERTKNYEGGGGCYWTHITSPPSIQQWAFRRDAPVIAPFPTYYYDYDYE